jgi:hypothetical protein
MALVISVRKPPSSHELALGIELGQNLISNPLGRLQMSSPTNFMLHTFSPGRDGDIWC